MDLLLLPTPSVLVPPVPTPAASGVGKFTAGMSPAASTITLSAVTGTIAVGQYVYGNWVGPGATVASIAGTSPNLTINLSNSGGTTNTGNNNYLFMPGPTPTYANTMSPGSAVTSNGTDFWLSSRETALLYYNGTNGALTTLASGSTSTAARFLSFFDWQLYGTNDFGLKAMTIGGAGSFPTGPTTTALLPFTSGSPVPASPKGFCMVDASTSVSGNDVLYVTQSVSGSGTTASNGVVKYTKTGSSWTVSGGYGVYTDNYQGLTAVWDGSQVTLYAIRKAGAQGPGGQLVKIVDAGGYSSPMSGTETVLAAYNTGNDLGGAWRGIAMAPEKSPVNAAGDVYYFIPATGDANVLSNWNSKPDGSGTPPASLYNANLFYIINNGRSATLTGSFGGSGVTISVGDETGGSLGQGSAGTLTTSDYGYLHANVNINKNSVLNYKLLPSPAYHPLLSYLDSSATVIYNGSLPQNVLTANYGNLTINNAAGVTLAGNIGVSNTLSVTAGTVNTVANSANITFNGSATQIIPGKTAWLNGSAHQITINNNAGGRLADSTTLTVLDSLIVNSGEFKLGAGSNLIIKKATYVPATPVVDSTYKPGYTLVWHDEFDGAANSFPNPAWWGQRYTDTTTTTVTFSGQNFLTKNIKSYNYLDGNGHYVSKINDSAGIYCVGGGIATAWPYNVMKQYGYMECKMTFTANNGVNCAFWLQSPTVSGNPAANDPATYGTEIDVCEYLGPSTAAPQGQVNTTIHKNGYNAPYHQQITNATTVSNAGWHILAVEWSPAYYKFYTDGVLKWTLTDTAFMSRHPELVILGSGIGWTPPNQAGNTWPVYMQADYVRIYNAAGSHAQPTNGSINATANNDTITLSNLSSGTTPLAAPGQIVAITGSKLVINSFAGTPAAGQTFTLLSAGTLTGVFASVSLPAGVTGTVSYPSNTAVLTIDPGPDEYKAGASFSVYPNPSSKGIVIVHGKASAGSAIIVYSSDGREVLRRKVIAGDVQTAVDVSALLPGAYMIMYQNATIIKTKIFIKETN